LLFNVRYSTYKELDFIESLSILKPAGEDLIFLIILSLFPPLRTAEEFGFGNIAEAPENSFSVTYQNLYSIPELQTVRINWLNDSYGLGISHFGTSFYRELILEGIFTKQIDKTFFLVQPSLLNLSQEDQDNFGFSADFLIGIILVNHAIYFKSFNPLSWIRNSTIPAELELCGIYSDEWNKIGIKINFLENWGIGLGFGYEIKFPTFNASLGLLTNPLIPTAGFSFEFSKMKFAIGIQNHPDLGLSETLTVNYSSVNK
jgi:hypothetical protein